MTPEEKRAYNREYYQRNRERIKRRRRERGQEYYYERDRDAARERHQGYRERNREKLREENRAYKAKNRDEIRERNRAYRERNRDVIRERGREYREQNPDRGRQYYVNNHDRIRERQNKYWAQNRDLKWAGELRYRHGIQPEAWAAMWAAQNGCCYLCGDELTAGKKQIHIDHDHRCCPQGQSCQFCRRGLACNHCNVAIGMSGDDPSRLRRMADALERAQAEVAERMAAKPIQDELGA